MHQGADRSRKRSHGYVSIYRRPATQPLGLRWGFETTSNTDNVNRQADFHPNKKSDAPTFDTRTYAAVYRLKSAGGNYLISGEEISEERPQAS
jgi:hypothetical protein